MVPKKLQPLPLTIIGSKGGDSIFVALTPFTVMAPHYYDLLYVFVFANFASKCKVICEWDRKSHARHITEAHHLLCTRPYTHKGEPQHRALHALLFSNSVWVL